MGRLTLILGGARSGKSSFAQQLARGIGGDDVLFVATAQPGDAEMADRIARHRATRPASWETHEIPRYVGETLSREMSPRNVVLIDCLTLWVSNILLSFADSTDFSEIEAQVRTELDSLIEFAQSRPGTTIVVSGEVGQGIVPESPLARRYRDLLGWANQQLAAESGATYQLVAGLAVEVKQLSRSLEQCIADARGTT
jgi:adenosylcobinamide kinase / adenosylcobinamide-phosphate guanylyltransferase